MIVDTHAHIYLDDFAKDLSEVLERALEAGLQKIYMPNIDRSSIDDMMEVEQANPSLCSSMMGLHPCSVNKEVDRELEIVERWLSQKTFAAIGEIGTDLHWDDTFWEEQVEALRVQLQWAIDYKIPAVLHCRKTLDQTIEIVEDLIHPDLTGVFHCFQGNPDQARKIVDLGFKLGIGGVVTFKNGRLDPVIKEIDLENFLLETDSPYLSPHPHRGKRNEPSRIKLVAERVSQIKKKSVEQIALVTTNTARALFK